MTYDPPWPHKAPSVNALQATLLAFPIACFSLTVLTDIAYWGTLNLLWLHFSEWLLLAGLVFGVLAMLVGLGDYAMRRARPAWPSVISGLVVLLLATLNSFIHTADGWTAVIPYGLTVSLLTLLAMAVMGWLACGRGRHA